MPGQAPSIPKCTENSDGLKLFLASRRASCAPRGEPRTFTTAPEIPGADAVLAYFSRLPDATADDGAGIEQGELEGVDVQATLHLGVGRQQDLEATVQLEAVDHVGAHAAPDAVGRLQHAALDPRGGQVLGARQSGQTGADDHDVDMLAHGRRVWCTGTQREGRARLAAVRCPRPGGPRPGRGYRRTMLPASTGMTVPVT